MAVTWVAFFGGVNYQLPFGALGGTIMGAKAIAFAALKHAPDLSAHDFIVT